MTINIVRKQLEKVEVLRGGQPYLGVNDEA
jgi:hypothetical protein